MKEKFLIFNSDSVGSDKELRFSLNGHKMKINRTRLKFEKDRIDFSKKIGKFIEEQTLNYLSCK